MFLSTKGFDPSVAPNSRLLVCGKPYSIFISCDVGLRGSLMVTKSIRVETHWHNNQKMPCSTQKYTQKLQPHLCIHSFTCFHMWCICQHKKVFTILNDWWPEESVFYLILLSLSLSLPRLRQSPKALHMGSTRAATWKHKLEQIRERQWKTTTNTMPVNKSSIGMSLLRRLTGDNELVIFDPD